MCLIVLIQLIFWLLISLREEIFSRLLSEVLSSVQDSVQKEMGLGLEGLRQQLSEMIASSAESPTQQAPDLARTQVDNYKIMWWFFLLFVVMIRHSDWLHF